MKKQFEILRACRKSILEEVDNLSLEQLQKVPQNMHNSIFWNIAHLLIIQQVSQYKLSGLDMLITNDWVENYNKGTKPIFLINEDEVEYVKDKLLSTVDQLEDDYNEKKFKNFTEYKTGMGVVLNTIEDAINYNNLHEGLHLGIIKTLKKLV